MVSSGNSVDDSLVRRAVLFEVKQDNLMESKKHISQSNLIQLVDETDDVEKLIFLLKKNNPDIVFLSTDNLNGEGNVAINKIRRYNQQVCIVAMGTKDETQAVLQYFRAGADEYLMKPIQRDELLSLLGRISAKPKYTHQKNLSFGKTIAVWGCRGGSGVTTIAANAAYLQQQSSPTILVDLHIEQGDLSLFFNMRNMNYSVKDLFDANSTFDEILVDNVTTQYKNGLSLLLQPIKGSLRNFNSTSVENLLTILKQKYKYVFLDIGHRDKTLLTVMPHIDEIILVINQNLPSILMGAKKISLLKNYCFNLNDVKVILNQYKRKHHITPSKIQKVLGTNHKINCIRDDSYYVDMAMNHGMPLNEIKRRSKTNKDIIDFLKRFYDDKSNKEKEVKLLPFNEQSIISPYRSEEEEVKG